MAETDGGSSAADTSGQNQEDVIETLCDVEELQQIFQKLHETMRKGFLKMADARFTMGSKSMSSMYFPPEIEPLVRVDM